MKTNIEPLPSYTGITGITTPLQARTLHDLRPRTRILMTGVLASDKSLRGIPTRYPFRYPAPEKIASIFTKPSSATLNLIHLHVSPEEDLAAFLALATETGGAHCQGLQLNVPWPDPETLARYRASPIGYGKTIVLQVGPKAIQDAGHNESMIARKLADYVGLAEYVLIDGSAGLAKELDPEFVANCFLAMQEQGLPFGRVAAGGLKPGKVSELLAPLLRRFPDFSTDAEGGVRDSADRLMIAQAINLIREQDELFA